MVITIHELCVLNVCTAVKGRCVRPSISYGPGHEKTKQRKIHWLPCLPNSIMYAASGRGKNTTERPLSLMSCTYYWNIGHMIWYRNDLLLISIPTECDTPRARCLILRPKPATPYARQLAPDRPAGPVAERNVLQAASVILGRESCDCMRPLLYYAGRLAIIATA